MARGAPGIYVDADMREAIKGMSFMKHFLVEMSTVAHIKTVRDATHAIFAEEFDQHISMLARTSPDNYHHVYEYSIAGDGYRSIGKRDAQLWIHTTRDSGDNLTFSWNWIPAKVPNPNYTQRRKSTVGFDAIRSMSNKEYRELLLKWREGGSRTWTFRWKAPMLEYGIERRQTAHRKAMMLPVPSRPSGKKDAQGNEIMVTKIFRKHVVADVQQPGDVTGYFLMAWTNFWGSVPQSRWEEVVGKEIAKDAEKRVAAAMAANKKIRPESRKFGAKVIIGDAYEAGRQQALAALHAHTRSIRGIEKMRGRYTGIVPS